MVLDLPRPRPRPGPGWARISVHLAGICKTDLEIMKGYRGFQGILGHEFLGVVDTCADPAWIGRRVVGEINAACGECRWCAQGLGRHCPRRTTLGILCAWVLTTVTPEVSLAGHHQDAFRTLWA